MNSPVINWRKTKQLHKSLSKKGRLLVWTKIYAAPAGFEHEAPYFAGIVKWQDGKNTAVQIVDIEEKDLKIGLEVVPVVRRLGKVGPQDVIDYTIKVKPLPRQRL